MDENERMEKDVISLLDEDGKEQDYMGLDLIAELETLADPIEFEILSHDVI